MGQSTWGRVLFRSNYPSSSLFIRAFYLQDSECHTVRLTASLRTEVILRRVQATARATLNRAHHNMAATLHPKGDILLRKGVTVALRNNLEDHQEALVDLLQVNTLLLNNTPAMVLPKVAFRRSSNNGVLHQPCLHQDTTQERKHKVMLHAMPMPYELR